MAVDDLRQMIGQTILVGLTYVRPDDTIDEQRQFAGIVSAVDAAVVSVTVEGDSEPFTLPADPAAFSVAEPGEYTLRSTGQVVSDPGYLVSWTIRLAADPRRS